jgi:hypothetical protein
MSPTIELKLTNQEQKVIGYLSGKQEVPWEELAQFAAKPDQVKLRTLQKVVSDIKKKYREVGMPAPFDCKFTQLVPSKTIYVDTTSITTPTTTATVVSAPVKVRVTAGGRQVRADDPTPDAVLDFKLDKNTRRVSTKQGSFALSENEWELFTFLLDNAGKTVSLEDMKNKIYHQWGSKTPHNWSEAISRTLTKLRKNIPELKTQNRLLTIVGATSTAYMLK